jgi:hypothetical protein
MRKAVLVSALITLLPTTALAAGPSELQKTDKLAGKHATNFIDNEIKHLCVCQDGSARDSRLGAIRKGFVGDPAIDESITLSCVVLAFRNGAQDLGGEFTCAKWVPLGK